MFSAGSAYEYLRGAAPRFGRAIKGFNRARVIFSICETINLYYNGVISMLCRGKRSPLQGCVFFLMRTVAALIIVLLPLSAVYGQYDSKKDLADLRSKTPEQRLSAAHKLAGKGSAKDKQKLREAVQAEKEAPVKSGMAEALAAGQTGEDTAGLVALLAPAEHQAVRASAAYSLGFSRTAAARDALLARLADAGEDKAVRLQAASSLLNYSAAPEVYAALRALCSDPDSELRAQGLTSFSQAYGLSRPEAVKPLLSAALADASPLVRKAAAAQLRALEVEK
jgi:HEAT repeat protein